MLCEEVETVLWRTSASTSTLVEVDLRTGGEFHFMWRIQGKKSSSSSIVRE